MRIKNNTMWAITLARSSTSDRCINPYMIRANRSEAITDGLELVSSFDDDWVGGRCLHIGTFATRAKNWEAMKRLGFRCERITMALDNEESE